MVQCTYVYLLTIGHVLILPPWRLRALLPEVGKSKSSDHATKNMQHYYYNSKVICSSKTLKSPPNVSISKFLFPWSSTFQSVRISISEPKMNQITQSNKANPLKCIEKNYHVLGISSIGQHLVICSTKRRTCLINCKTEKKTQM